MTTDKHEVELIIKGSNLTGKTVKEVSKSVDDLTESLSKQAAAAKKGEVSLGELKGTLGELDAAGKRLVSQEALIARFKRMAQATEEARQKVNAAANAYEALAEEQSFQGEVTKKQDKELASLAKTTATAETNFKRLERTLATIRAELETAGIDSKQLGTAQESLVQVAKRQAAAYQQAAKEVADYAANARVARKAAAELAEVTRRANEAMAKNPFATNGRTTLSLLQRIRGEVLALAAAYVGLQGAIQGVSSVLDTVRKNQQIQTQLLAANGNDANAAALEYRYLREQAERLGIFLPTLAKQYASFSIAARKAGLSTEELRFTFERVAEAGRVLQLDDSNIEGIFNAITQMVSKGKIQTEELRGQLGDRLPGALIYAAQQYEGGVKEFIKQLELGNVAAEAGVINIARGLDQAFAAQVDKATQDLAAQEARFQNALADFKQIIADAGLTDSYKELLRAITDFFRSPEGIDFAKSIAAAFKVFADTLVFVIKNLETFKILATAIIELYLARLFFSMAQGVINFSGSLIQMNKDLKAGRSELGKTQKAFLLLQAAIIGFQIGDYLQENFESARKVGVFLVTTFAKAWTVIKYQAKIAWESVGSSWTDAVATILNTTTFMARGMLGIFEKLARAGGANKLADNFKSTIDSLTIAGSDSAEERIKLLREQMTRELSAISEDARLMFEDASDAARKAAAAAEQARNQAKQGVPTTDPGGRPAIFDVDPDAAANKYKQLLNQIEAVEAAALKKQKDSMAAVIAGIDKQYQALFRKIRASGLEGAAALETRLAAAVNQLKAEAAKNYNQDQLDKIEAIQNRFAAIQTTLGKSSLGDFDQRIEAIDAQFASLYNDIAALDADRQGNLKVQLDLMIEQLKVVEKQKFGLEALKESEQTVNELITERDAKIRTVSDLVDAGLKTEVEARQMINEILAESQPQIETMAFYTKEVAEELRGIVDDSTLDQIVAKMDLATASAGRFKTELYSASQANEDMAAGITGALKESARGFGEVITGAKSLGDAMRNAGKAFLQFAADFLMKIAEMIIQQIILNALQSSGFGGMVSGGVNAGAGVMHTGGIVGSGSGRSRAANPAWFSNAPRYHSGGIAGLKANEVPIIAEKNEEILSKDDPRNIINGGATGKAPVVVPAPQVTVNNMIDSGELMASGLDTPQGNKAFNNHIRDNKRSINAALGRG